MQYTVLNISGIKKIISQYDIGEVTSFKVLSGGSENTNYLIATNSEKYVLTICEQKTPQETINLCRLLEYLAENNFSTSKVIRNKEKKVISIYQEKPVMLKSFIHGKIIDDLPNSILTLIGFQMGKLHQIKAPGYLPKKLNYGVEHFDEVAIYDKNSPYQEWLNNIKNKITPYITANPPQTLIHGDVFYSNVIIENKEQEVTIMDFEEATYYYRIFDVGMAIVGLCCESEKVNLTKVSALLKGYTQETQLTDAEQSALQPFTIYAAAAMSFWRHKNFNYTNPTPSMRNHYLELKNVADFIIDLPQQCFQQILDEGK